MSLSSRFKANDSDDDSDGSDGYFELAKKKTLQRQHGIGDNNVSSSDAGSDVEDICLKFISENLNDAGIKNICSQFGEVKSYRRMQKPPYFAFVTYATKK